jgi:hypothetical protein
VTGFIDRQLIAQLSIAAGACVGAWLLAVEPRQRERAQLRAQISQRESEAGAMDATAIATRSAAITQQVESISARNALGADSSVLYGNIMSLARQAAVTVQNVRPSSEDRANASPSTVDINRLEIVVDGTYAQLADFLDSLGRLNGYLRPSGLTLTPLQRDGQHLATARIAYEAVEFKIPEPLRALSQGATNDQP